MNKLRIGVADDHYVARQLLVDLLQSLGHEVICAAADGADLVEQCLDSMVDVVCVDLDMPNMDGLAAAEIFAAKEIPVILVSGHPDVEHIVAENEPIVTFLMKPISIDELRVAIIQSQVRRSPPRFGASTSPAIQ